MTQRSLKFGDIATVVFPNQNPQGREQEGYRPAIVVGIPERLGIPRFSVLVVVPLTTDKGMPWSEQSPALYPRLPAGTAGLSSASIALLDQVRCVDVSRVVKYRGCLSAEQLAVIAAGLSKLFGLTDIDEPK